MSGRFVKVWGVTGLLVAMLCAGWSFAQRAADIIAPELLLPEQSIIYMKTDGSLLHQAAFEKTAAYEALFASGLMGKIEEIFKTMTPAGQDAEDMTVAMKHIEQNGLSIGVTVDPPQQGIPQAWGVIVVHQAGDGVELVDRLVAKIPGDELDIQNVTVRGRDIKMAMVPDSPVEIGYWSEQGHLMIAIGMGAIESSLAVVDGDRENLSVNPLFKRYSTETDVEFHTTSWLEFETLRNMFGGMPVPAPAATPDEPVTVNDVLVAVGLQNLNHIAARGGYNGPAMWNELIVDAPGEKTGLLTLLEQQSLTLDDIPPIPMGQNGFVVSSFDWGNTYDALLDVCFKVAKFGPQDAEQEIQSGLQQMEEELGLNVRDDLLAHIGHVNCIYTDAKQGVFGTGSTVLMSVKNQAGLKQSLKHLMNKAVEESNGDVQFTDIDKDGHSLTLMQFPKFPLFSPAIYVGEDWIIVGILPQAVEATLMRLDGKLPSWKANDEYKAAFDALPKEFTSLTAMEPRGTYQFLISAAPTLVGFAELGIRESGSFPEDFEIPFSPADIPPAEVITAPLFPNLSVTTTDENGVHVYSRQSMAGIPLLGGSDSGTAVATTGVLVALLLPAVQAAREAARRIESTNNMKQIMLALHNYHDTNNGFPPGTIENKDLEPEDRLSWLVSILPYLEQQALWSEINMKEGWQADSNQFRLETVVPTYHHPSSTRHVTDDFHGVSDYVGIAGLGEDGPTLPVTHKRAGVFGYDRATKMRDITDGTSNTIAIAEVNDGAAWGAGGRSTIRPFTEKPYINGPDGFGSPSSRPEMNIGLCDGSVRTISEDIDPSVLEALTTIRGGEVVGDF